MPQYNPDPEFSEITKTARLLTKRPTLKETLRTRVASLLEKAINGSERENLEPNLGWLGANNAEIRQIIITHLDANSELLSLLNQAGDQARKASQAAQRLTDGIQVHDCKIIKTALTDGANPDSTSPQGWGAYHIAAMNNDVDLIKLLAEKNTKANIATPNGRYPIEMATEPDAIIALLAAGHSLPPAKYSELIASKPERAKSLSNALLKQKLQHFGKELTAGSSEFKADTEEFISYIESDCDINMQDKETGLTLLHIAALMSSEKLTKKLIETLESKDMTVALSSQVRTSKKINSSQVKLELQLKNTQETALFFAKSEKIIQLLVTAGANLTALKKRKKMAFDCLKESGSITPTLAEFIFRSELDKAIPNKLLIEKLIELESIRKIITEEDIKKLEKILGTQTEQIAKIGKYLSLKKIFQKLDTLDIEDEKFQQSVIRQLTDEFKIADHGYRDLNEYLHQIIYGWHIDLTMTSSKGWSLLHLAIMINDSKIAKYILRCLPETERLKLLNNKLGTRNYTALAFTKSPEMCDLLLQHGADPLIQHLRSNHPEETQKNKKPFDILMERQWPDSAIATYFLAHALKNNKQNIDQFLCIDEYLAKGADANVLSDNVFRLSAAHIAVETGNSHLLAALKEAKANINQSDLLGNTPLHLVKDIETLKAMFDEKLDLDIRLDKENIRAEKAFETIIYRFKAAFSRTTAHGAEHDETDLAHEEKKQSGQLASTLKDVASLFLRQEFRKSTLTTTKLEEYLKYGIDDPVSLLIKLSDTPDKAKDRNEIIELIKKCTSNALLKSLHKDLSTAKYDYLRKYRGYSRYQTIAVDDTSANKVSTSHSWALIERAISIQWHKNMLHSSIEAEMIKPLCVDATRKKRLVFFSVNGQNNTSILFSRRETAEKALTEKQEKMDRYLSQKRRS